MNVGAATAGGAAATTTRDRCCGVAAARASRGPLAPAGARREVRAGALSRRRFAAALALAAVCNAARGADGHFDVDDATILETGHCQVRNMTNGQRDSLAGAQVKWVADPAARRFRIGAVLARTRSLQGTGASLASAYVPATLWLGSQGRMQLHLNLGRDRDFKEESSTKRWGIAVDQALNDDWTLAAERRGLQGGQLTRAGVRLNLGPLTSFDASAAMAGRSRVWGLGLNHEWER